MSRRFFYALGGGTGHLTRALALVRRLPGDGAGENIVLCNSPFSGAVLESAFARSIRLSAEVLPADLGADAIRRVVPELVRESDPGMLVVDTFPRGIVGELSGLLVGGDRRAVLVHRDLSERYVRQYDLGAFVRRHYQRVLVPGEDAPLESEANAVRTAPWLLLDGDELKARAEARERMGVPDDARPLVVFSGCGKREEIEELEGLAAEVCREFGDRLHARVAALRFTRGAGVPVVGHWPLFELFRGIDLVVGSGGYHTVNEARATATPLLAVPRKRMYDRQEARVSASEKVSGRFEVLERIGRFLETFTSPEPEALTYENGVWEALRHL